MRIDPAHAGKARPVSAGEPIIPARTASFFVMHGLSGHGSPGRMNRPPAATAGEQVAVFTPATLGARGEVAQLVEHTAENRGVAGSIPALANALLARLRRASLA